jgi:heptosyltransferase-2
VLVGSVVVRAPNWVGDAVMSLGGLREVRRIVGGARLAVAARPWVAGIFEESGVADEVISLERRSWRDALTAVRELRRRRFASAVLFPNSFETALVARLARIRRVVGFATDGRRLLLSDPLALPAEAASEHQARYYMRIAAGFERALTGETHVDLDSADASLTARPETVSRGRAILAQAGVPPGTPVVVLNPGATNSRAKRWLPERFAAVGDALAERLDARVAIIGAPTEGETADRVASLMRAPERAAVIAGRTSIVELVGVLANASALVSNDTGPAHLGAALGVATVTIFGPTEHFATHPVGLRAAIVRRPVECSPCMLRDCPIDHRCMTRVEVADVLDAVASVTPTAT